MLRSWQFIGMAGALVLVVSGWSLIAAERGASGDWKAPSREARKSNPIPPDEGSTLTGKTVFVRECAQCHGETGKGNGRAAHLLDKQPADLTSSRVLAQSDGTLFWKISSGQRPMPTFENVLPPESRWNIINYQRTLAPRPATQPSQAPVR